MSENGYERIGEVMLFILLSAAVSSAISVLVRSKLAALLLGTGIVVFVAVATYFLSGGPHGPFGGK